MTAIQFTAFPKIPRLNRTITITEKIDGTNAAVGIIPNDDGTTTVYAQSRNRLITPEADNYGFARWVEANRDRLIALLGPGLHFGEWWGSGIQRAYGLKGGEKRFSLFNTDRHKDVNEPDIRPVPVLYRGANSSEMINAVLAELARNGSVAAPGFMDPEGIVVFHAASRSMAKVTVKNDAQPKSAHQIEEQAA